MCKQIFEGTKKQILDQIKGNNYPKNHPFLDKRFENDQVLHILVLLKLILNNDELINDYINNKLKAHNNGIFAFDKYHQVLCEILFLWYLISGLIFKDNFEIVSSLKYEPILDNGKKMEYSLFDNTLNKTINFEIKHITVDPFIKNPDLNQFEENKYIKSFFKTDLTNISEDISGYILLKSEYKIVRAALKKISLKFLKKENQINIGIIVCQYGASMEDYFSFFLHPSKGYINKNEKIFENFDVIVLFSMTAIPDITFEQIYTSENIVSIITSNRVAQDFLEKYRLDNVIANNGEIHPHILKYTQETYAKYKYKIIDGFAYFFREDVNDEDIKIYTDKINAELTNSN